MRSRLLFWNVRYIENTYARYLLRLLDLCHLVLFCQSLEHRLLNLHASVEVIVSDPEKRKPFDGWIRRTRTCNLALAGGSIRSSQIGKLALQFGGTSGQCANSHIVVGIDLPQAAQLRLSCDQFPLQLSRGLDHGLPLFLDVQDRKSTRLNSSHGSISYAVFC